MDASSKQTAQQAITELFKFMDIKRVVCVDDEYASTVSIEEFIAVCSVLNPTDLQAIPELAPFVFDEEDIWRVQLRAKWEEFEEDTKTQLYRQILLLKGNGETDTKDAGILGSLLAGHELQELSPSQWKKMKGQLLQDVVNHKTLFLFDQNLIRDGGSETGGITLIQEILSSEEYSDKVMCGLLSSTFEPDIEIARWHEYAKDYTLDRDKFVLISKRRLSEDPLGFARMVKLTVLNTHCRVMKEKVSTVLHTVNQQAQNRVEEINIYDFEHIVFHSSNREGVWEPDTLFRIYGLYQRAAARQQAREDAELHALAGRIRNVSNISTKSNGVPPLNSWKIQRMEMYERHEYLNSLHMPIELGDIFQQTNGKKYILLAQPCDLMVRSDGKRHHAVTEVTLAGIVDAMPKKKSSSEIVGHDAHYELQYFDETSGVSRFVSFRKAHTVRLFVLDLCVYQDDGSAKLQLEKECSANVIPTWKLHHIEISKGVRKAITRYADFANKGSARDILKLLIPCSSNENLFKGTIDPQLNTISYDFARVGRLCQPYSGAMLTKYATYIARTAFEHDFGKDIEDEQ